MGTLTGLIKQRRAGSTGTVTAHLGGRYYQIDQGGRKRVVKHVGAERLVSGDIVRVDDIGSSGVISGVQNRASDPVTVVIDA